MRVIESKRTNDVRIRSYQIEIFVLKKKQLYANLDEVKKNCQENHWQCLEEGAKREIKTALALQVPSSLRTPHGENEKHINDVRKAKIKAVHE